MMRRLLGSLGAAMLLAVFSIATTHGQSLARSGGAVVPGAAAKGYVQPKTPDGQPDLTGFWTNATFTPLQRPNNVKKDALHAGRSHRGGKGGRSARGRADHTGHRGRPPL